MALVRPFDDSLSGFKLEVNLTAFESRTLELFASGLARSEIARIMKRSPKTISNTLTAAKDKLGARSLTEAAVLLKGSRTG